MSDSITCPECGAAIPLTEAISHQVEERLRREVEAASRVAEDEHARALAEKDVELQTKIAEARAELEAAARARAEETVAAHIRDLSSRVEEQSARLAEAESKELSLLKEKRELQERHEASQAGGGSVGAALAASPRYA